MKVDKSTWSSIPFTECVRTVKVNDAVQKKDYNTKGLYPIISQEKEFISGYCDNVSNLNKGFGNLIIFGDHTRIIKFIDFDFCVGADGVKVLRPFGHLDAKYLFYFLRWADIPSNGYSRHFKFLKELIIPHPPIDAQYDIASELDALQEVIDGYRDQIADLDTLAQSIFLDTFGHVSINDRDWYVLRLGDLGTLKNGLNFDRQERGNKIKVIGVGDFKQLTCLRNFDAISSVEISNLGSEYLLQNEDIIFVRSNGNKNLVGRCLEVYPGDEDISYSGFCIRFRKSSDIINSYLIGVLSNSEYKKTHILKSNGIGIQNINQKLLSNLPIPIPPMELQQQFANKVAYIEQQKDLLRQQLADAEMLMAERMQYYFS